MPNNTTQNWATLLVTLYYVLFHMYSSRCLLMLCKLSFTIGFFSKSRKHVSLNTSHIHSFFSKKLNLNWTPTHNISTIVHVINFIKISCLLTMWVIPSPFSLTQKKTVATRILLKCKFLEQSKRHKVWQVASKLTFLS